VLRRCSSGNLVVPIFRPPQNELTVDNTPPGFTCLISLTFHDIVTLQVSLRTARKKERKETKELQRRAKILVDSRQSQIIAATPEAEINPVPASAESAAASRIRIRLDSVTSSSGLAFPSYVDLVFVQTKCVGFKYMYAPFP
jgi:hypothetical protein